MIGSDHVNLKVFVQFLFRDLSSKKGRPMKATNWVFCMPSLTVRFASLDSTKKVLSTEYNVTVGLLAPRPQVDITY